MVSLQKICAALSECYPPQCAESWDNPGLLLGRNRAEIRRVVVALELTPEVVEEAIETRAELIVTHHPFIFKPMSSLTDSSPDGRMMLDLAAAGIALYAAHTNLDSAPAAIGEKLACDLGLMDVRALLSHEPFSSYNIVVFVPHTARGWCGLCRALSRCFIPRHGDWSFHRRRHDSPCHRIAQYRRNRRRNSP